MQSNPVVSVLITTYNRSRLLRRALSSVLKQSFREIEIVVIDDCSPDDTASVVGSFNDARVRYIRNTTNVGGKEGDRPHVRRFLNELMRGEYFVYLCDDDYWLPPDLLERQIALFRANQGLAFVFGNQLSYNLSAPESYLEGSPEETMTFTWQNLDQYFDLSALQPKTSHLTYEKKIYPKTVMTSEEYLTYFSEKPALCNRADGATLYSKRCFMAAGAMRAPVGSQWQAGFEFKMGPATVGGVAFFDEPALLTEIRYQNASFRRTQIDHYRDSVKSIEVALTTPIAEAPAKRRRFLKRIKSETIRNLTHSYLMNTVAIRKSGTLTMCSPENIAQPVTIRQVLPIYVRNGMTPTFDDLNLLIQTQLA